MNDLSLKRDTIYASTRQIFNTHTCTERWVVVVRDCP